MGGGPPGFTRDSTSLVLLWNASQRGPLDFAYGTFTLFGRPFQSRSAILGFVTPQGARNPELFPARFGLCALSLAATDAIDVSFFSCGY